MINKKICFVFPGQGSQSLGMGKSLAQAFPIVNDIFSQADDILGYQLSRIAWEGPEETLNDTINTQPALFTHSVAVLQLIQDLKPYLVPSFVAGHSMGELSALVAAGSLSFSDGLKLVRMRGVLMKRAGDMNPGGMAAIMGLDISQIDQLCTIASSASEIVQVANDNCPGQVVISGSNIALDRVQPLLEQAGAKKVIRLAVSIAAHSPFMDTAQEDFNTAVTSARIKAPFIPVIGNVTAKPLLNESEISEDLQKQLTHRVRWTESIEYLVSEGITNFIEVGNGSVLGGLIKRIDRNVITTSLGTLQDFQRLIE
jgi:[acyl-carrier-protein] S-malonyltransferase